MLGRLRSLARRVLGVTRESTYYLPWLTRPGLECVVLVNNIESRFTSGRSATATDLDATVTQYDAGGGVVGVYTTALSDSADAREVRLTPTAAGHGFVTVRTRRIHSDLYVALVDGESYSATHGRQEFIEHYPPWTRAALAIAGGALAVAGGTVPALRARPVRLSRSGQPLARAHLQSVERRQPGPRGRHPRRHAGRDASAAAAADGFGPARHRHPGAAGRAVWSSSASGSPATPGSTSISSGRAPGTSTARSR